MTEKGVLYPPNIVSSLVSNHRDNEIAEGLVRVRPILCSASPSDPICSSDLALARQQIASQNLQLCSEVSNEEHP